MALIKGQQSPIVAAGDFNFSNHSNEHKWLVAFLNDAYHRAGQGSGFTWPVKCMPSIPVAIPCIRIDYLFHSSSFQSYSALIGEQTGSDHLPLLSEIALEN